MIKNLVLLFIINFASILPVFGSFDEATISKVGMEIYYGRIKSAREILTKIVPPQPAEAINFLHEAFSKNSIFITSDFKASLAEALPDTSEWDEVKKLYIATFLATPPAKLPKEPIILTEMPPFNTADSAKDPENILRIAIPALTPEEKAALTTPYDPSIQVACYALIPLIVAAFYGIIESQVINEEAVQKTK